MGPHRIHITGASGAGTSTLGAALAQRFAVPHHDTDDYYWMPTPLPYTEKRVPSERLALMEALFLPRPAWVLSGSLAGWGDPLIPRFTAVVFVSASTEKRLTRLRAREKVRLEAQDTPDTDVSAFLDWAACYDDPSFDGRSREMHEVWLEHLPCPVIRVDGGAPLDTLVETVSAELAAARRVEPA